MSCRCGRHNNDKENAPLAQLVEHLTLNQGVQGSSPWRCTRENRFWRHRSSGDGSFFVPGKQLDTMTHLQWYLITMTEEDRIQLIHRRAQKL